VLRFSDEKNISSLEQQNVVLDLAARLKQVEGQLRAVNSQFARLSGVSGAHAFSLDLYGRMPAAKDDQGTLARSMLQRRSSKRLPLPEAAQALVQMASRTLPPTKHGRSASMSDSPSATPMPMAGLLEQGSVGPSRQGSGIIASRSSSPSLRPGKERQTVRFDKSVSFGDEAAVARRAATGVLEITDDSAPEGSALPYRHLIIRAGSEAGPSGEGQGSPKAQAPGMPPLPPPPAGATRPVRRGESRDWGHITSDEKLGAGSRVMAGNKSGPVGSSWPTDTGVAPRPSAVARRQELLKLMSDGDAVLLIGGDLNVTVVQARDLAGASRSTHPFARVHIRDPVPPPPTEERSKQTSVVWQTVDPVWDEQLLFRDVCAASELVVELWDLGGTKSTAQLNALALNSAGNP